MNHVRSFTHRVELGQDCRQTVLWSIQLGHYLLKLVLRKITENIGVVQKKTKTRKYFV